MSTTPDAKTLAELWLPLKARMEKAGYWPSNRVTVGGVTVTLAWAPPALNRNGGQIGGFWRWEQPNVYYSEALPFDAANALRCCGEDWLWNDRYVEHHGRPDVAGRCYIVVDDYSIPNDASTRRRFTDIEWEWDEDRWQGTFRGATYHHALTAALAALLPEVA